MDSGIKKIRLSEDIHLANDAAVPHQVRNGNNSPSRQCR
jgi:hypothetical protein